MPEIADQYAYRVLWSEEDEEFVGLCSEFGSLSHLDDTPEKAFSGIRKLVAFSVRWLHEEGKPVPEPIVHPTLQRHSHASHPTRHAPLPRYGCCRSWSKYEPVGCRASGITALAGADREPRLFTALTGGECRYFASA